ncbi:MAG: DciA family protein [Methylomonas sp.]
MIAEQNKLLAIVKTALPDEIAKSVVHCVKSKQRLLLYTESASWASQIRFFHQAILNKLAETEYKNIQGLQVKIQPKIFEQKVGRVLPMPSANNIRMIKEQVNNQEQDELNQALLRLSNTLEKRLKAKV